MFASWDAEEFTLTSSTEWGEQHARTLTQDAVAYLNVDSSASGPSLATSAVPSLNRLVTEAAESVVDPLTGGSIAAAGGPAWLNNRLGGGSDYAVFLNFLGIPVADLSFTGPYGVYHSVYDNHRWMAAFGDLGFSYHVTMTRLWGLLALRLANADVVPLDYRAYADRLREFADELRSRAQPRDREALQPLRSAVDRFARAALAMDRRVGDVVGLSSPSARSVAATRALMAVERALLDRNGIPGRPWYRHVIFAPKPTYAPEVLPGVAEALDAGDRTRLADQVTRLIAALDRAAALLNVEPR